MPFAFVAVRPRRHLLVNHEKWARTTLEREPLKTIQAGSHYVRMDELLAPRQLGRGTGATIAVPHGL
jgi:hypothetical protein